MLFNILFNGCDKSRFFLLSCTKMLNINHQYYQDKIHGVLFGQAIGDALGLGAEFLTKEKIKQYYPNNLTNYEQIVVSPHTRRWQKGEWTDDTCMMLCILDSLMVNQTLKLDDIAKRWLAWVKEDGRGIGKLTARIMGDKRFVAESIVIAKQYWQQMGCHNAPNGGVMRTAAVGLWQHWHLNQVTNYAELICAMTHADPRCIESARIISLVIARLLNGEVATKIFYDLFAQASSEAKLFFYNAEQGDIELFNLDGSQQNNNDPEYGYTFKCLGVGLWALLNPTTFEDGLLTVIHEGGDADTNAAVAGAILGARFGYHAIHEMWINKLINKNILYEKAQFLINTNRLLIIDF